MLKCQACGSETNGPDRFCRNCGAPIASLVGDLDDTLRFERASGSLGKSGPQLPTNPFYVAPPVPDVVRPESAASRFASLLAKIRMLPKGLVWVGLFLLLLLTVSAGVTIGRGVILARRNFRRHLAEEARRLADNSGEQEVEPQEAEQDSSAEEVQNALGFVPADVPDEAYPGLAGVFVDTLTGDASPAAAAHIQAGDVITALNGKAITSPEDMMEIIKPLKTGSEVTAKLFRDEASLEVRIKTADPAHEPFKPETEPKNQGFLGLGDVDRRCCVPGTKTWGLEIHRIVDNSSADLAGLQTGDVIVEFDGRPVRTPGELARRIRAAAPRSKVKIKFYRGDTAQTAEVIMGHQTGGDDSGGDDSGADDSGGDNI